MFFFWESLKKSIRPSSHCYKVLQINFQLNPKNYREKHIWKIKNLPFKIQSLSLNTIKFSDSEYDNSDVESDNEEEDYFDSDDEDEESTDDDESDEEWEKLNFL